MRKTGLIILMTAAALSMSACGRTEKPESTKPSGTVANEKETQKRHYLRVNQRQQQLMKTFCS